MSLSLANLKTNRQIEPFKYSKLSPRTINFSKKDLSLLENSQECEEILKVKPNMELRKQESKKIRKSQRLSDSFYLRNRRWKEETEQKINKKKWDLHVSEMSTCTFAPSLLRVTESKKAVNLVTH